MSIDFIPVIILYMAIAIFLFYAYYYLRRRKKRNADTYAGDMEQFNKAVLIDDVELMNYYGDRIIWNEYLEQSDKKIIYEAVKSRVSKNEELNQLWKDVHYKTHGHEPLNNNSTNTKMSQDDILDQ